MPLPDWQPVIGLEVHAQMLTRSKIFCGCSTAFGGEPNAHTCPVCLGMPGVLPVLNEKVVEFAIRTGLALGCQIPSGERLVAEELFYPDLPKGYQISQYDQPICEHGILRIDLESGTREIRILRIHMEEDAGKNVHAESESLVDLNRAGVPLLEIVSEPDVRSSDEAAEYMKTLRDVLVYLGVNDGNLEEGSFRCDANVSIMPKGATKYGQRTELKNINSFRYVKQAIDIEVARQVELLESGGKVTQETRLFDPVRGETRPMRSKEDAHDYRYFPEPDLPPLHLLPARVEEIRKTLPELPRAKLERFQKQYGLPAYDAKVLCAERPLAEYFEQVVQHAKDAKKVSNWFLGELLRLLKEESRTLESLLFTPAQFGALLTTVEKGEVSANAAKGVFAEMFRTGKDPKEIIAEKGLGQVQDVSAVQSVVDEIVGKNPGEVASYKAGKQQVFGFFVGQVMKAMKGKGNPTLVNELLKKKLDGDA